VSALASPVQPNRALGLYAFVAGVVSLALVAGVIGLLFATDGPPSLPPAPPHLGQAVPTSFGVVSVDQVERLAASNPDRRELSPGESELQVALTSINVLDHSVPYSRDQVSLRIGRNGLPIQVKTASIASHELQASTAFRGVFRFVVPTGVSNLWIGFKDPGRSTPILIHLGNGPFPVGLSTAYNPHQHGNPHQQGVAP
jgi:hypothetical protein